MTALILLYVAYSAVQWFRWIMGAMHEDAALGNSRRHFSRPGMRAWAEEDENGVYKLRIEGTGDQRDHSERCKASLNDWRDDKRWVDWWPLRWVIHTILFTFIIERFA